MKKFVLIVLALFCLCQCSSVRNEYKASITYTIQNSNPIKHTVHMSLPDGFVPAYVYDSDTGVLYVHGNNGHRSYGYHVVYQGSLSINVKDFGYENVRTYEVSNFDGHQLKKK